MIRNYTELIELKTFEERFRYLKLDGSVCKETFGFDRIFNQQFYKSNEWKRTRDYVITRDLGCDLGIEEHIIAGETIIVHHMNPIAIQDIKYCTDILLNPEYLITTVLRTHNAIHFGDENLLFDMPAERKPNDTCPWRR